MKKVIQLIFVSVLMILTAPVYADSVVQVYECERDDDTTDEQIEAMAEEWLKAAKGVKGGENLELYLNFPIAGQVGEMDLTMVLIAPSFAEWGTFTDNYDGSAVDKVDEKYSDDVDCPDSMLWDSVKVE